MRERGKNKRKKHFPCAWEKYNIIIRNKCQTRCIVIFPINFQINALLCTQNATENFFNFHRKLSQQTIPWCVPRFAVVAFFCGLFKEREKRLLLQCLLKSGDIRKLFFSSFWNLFLCIRSAEKFNLSTWCARQKYGSLLIKWLTT